jgi:hypothetical protein
MKCSVHKLKVRRLWLREAFTHMSRLAAKALVMVLTGIIEPLTPTGGYIDGVLHRKGFSGLPSRQRLIARSFLS